MNTIEYKRKAVAVPDDDANGTTIRDLRHASCMTQTELAQTLGISNSYLCDMEAGKRSMDEGTFDKAREAILKYTKANPTVTSK